MLNDNYEARFVTELLLNCQYLNAKFWPDYDDEKVIYGNKQARNDARLFSLDPVTTVLAFTQAKAGAFTGEYDELLRLIKTFPVSTAQRERGFSALNGVCTKIPNCICMTTCDAIFVFQH